MAKPPAIAALDVNRSTDMDMPKTVFPMFCPFAFLAITRLPPFCLNSRALGNQKLLGLKAAFTATVESMRQQPV
jgi:hypothetical protein